MFRDIFSFDGRIRRLEYGLSYLGFIAYSYFVGIMIGIFIGLRIMPDLDQFQTKEMYYIGCLPAFYVFLAQSVKRCHDKGNSGWCIFIPFYLIILLFDEGDKHQNKYGANPKLSRPFVDPFVTNSEPPQIGHIVEVEPIDNVDEDGIIQSKETL